MKLCKACGLEKPETEFHKDRSKPDGLNAYCKPCQRERQKRFNMSPPRIPAPPGMKRCQTCKQIKPLDEFYAEAGHYDGHQPRCKECQTKRHKEWSEKNRPHLAKRMRERRAANPERYADYERFYNYGLKRGDYNALLAAQDGRCAICGSDDPGAGRKNFHVDHCHKTKAIRGLLCHGCNVGLGNFGDSIDNLSRAITYLTKCSR